MTDFKYGNIWSRGVPFGGGKPETAAELKEAAKINTHFTAYYFTESEMQTFLNLVCKEQREKCQISFNQNGGDLLADLKAIKNAPKPDGL